jgi:hypothetical protein
MTLTGERSEVRAAPSPGQPAPARGPRLSTVFTCLFAVGGFAIGIRQLHDNSFMWHLSTGSINLDHGIPRHDPYSFTAPGAKWVAQSWLAELLYGVVNRAGGAFGLRLLGGVVGCFVGFMLFRLAWRGTRDRIRAGGLTILALAALMNVWSERPLMYGLAAMLVIVAVVEAPDSRLGRHPYVVLPVAMWIWANMHGSFIIGLGYLGLHLVGRALEHHPPTRGRERDLLRASVLAGLLTLLNPYFLDLVLFPLRLMGRGEVLRDVSEWQSPSFREAGGMLFGAFVLFTLVLFARKRVGTRDVLITVVFTLLGLWAIRNVGLTVIAILPIQARLARNENPRPDERASVHRLMVATAVIALLLSIVHAAGQEDWNLKTYPVDAFNAIKAQGFEGRRLYTTDGWGGYVIARAWPDQKVFFDDRYDMYPIQVNHDYTAIAAVGPAWKDLLDRYRVDVVMSPSKSALVQALAERPDWTPIYTDKTATVYVRRAPANA